VTAPVPPAEARAALQAAERICRNCGEVNTVEWRQFDFQPSLPLCAECHGLNSQGCLWLLRARRGNRR
jgi:hypothetical protein